MSVTMQVLHTVTSARAIGNESQTPIVTYGGAERYAMWKSVFQDARPTQFVQEMRGPPSGFVLVEQETFNESGDGPNALLPKAIGAPVGADFDSALSSDLHDARRPHSVSTSSALHGDANGVDASATATELRMIDINRMTKAMQASTPSNETSAVPPAHSRGRASEAEVCAAGIHRVSYAVTPRTGAEAVNVFIHETGVAIVVRDARVSDRQALLCAFEAARELTGQAGGLQRLTVNGRVLYRQANDFELAGPRLLLAC